MADLKVCIVDDSPEVRDSLALFLEKSGLRVECYPSGDAFLDRAEFESAGCLVLDLHMPGMGGLELQQALASRRVKVPIVFLSGRARLCDSATAFRAGAVDFLEKPVDPARLLERVREALARASGERDRQRKRESVRLRLERLTSREREVMPLVISGASNKQIARHLGVSHRTVEAHRAQVMLKMEVRSLPELIEAANVAGIRARGV